MRTAATRRTTPSSSTSTSEHFYPTTFRQPAKTALPLRYTQTNTCVFLSLTLWLPLAVVSLPLSLCSIFMHSFSEQMRVDCGVIIIDMSIEDVKITNPELVRESGTGRDGDGREGKWEGGGGRLRRESWRGREMIRGRMCVKGNLDPTERWLSHGPAL